MAKRQDSEQFQEMKKEMDDARDTRNSYPDMNKGENKLLFDENELLASLEMVEALLAKTMKFLNGVELTDRDRLSMKGSGVRRYGFIGNISNMMSVHRSFVPSFLDEEKFKGNLRELEIIRNINVGLQQILRINSDIMLITGDDLYRRAMMFYGSVREASLRKVQGAASLYHILKQFFHLSRRATDEPTAKEVEHDVKALLHGKKEGTVIIKNKKPHLTGGEHKVIDNVQH